MTVSKNYYDNLAVTLNGKIEEAQQGNETWQDSDLSAAITQAEGVHAGGRFFGRERQAKSSLPRQRIGKSLVNWRRTEAWPSSG